MEETDKFLFSVAFNIELNERTKVTGWINKDVEVGEMDEIKAAARKRADEILEEFYEVVQRGPIAVREFLKNQQQVKDNAKKNMEDKFEEASSNAKTRASVYGGISVILSGLKFCFLVSKVQELQKSYCFPISSLRFLSS